MVFTVAFTVSAFEDFAFCHTFFVVHDVRPRKLITGDVANIEATVVRYEMYFLDTETCLYAEHPSPHSGLCSYEHIRSATAFL